MELVDKLDNKRRFLNRIDERHNRIPNEYKQSMHLWIMNKDGELLIQKRSKNKESYPDMWAITSGSTAAGESTLETVIRECKEELGVDVSDVKYLCSFPNTYEYRSITYKTCDLFFTAVLKEGEEFKEQKSEVSGIVWKSVNSNLFTELAFESANKALTKWTEEKSK